MWNHVAVAVGPDTLVEAVGDGVRERRFDPTTEPTRFRIAHVELFQQDREEARSFAESAVGESYGWPTIAKIALTLFTPHGFTFGVDGTQICSGLAARSLEHAGRILPFEALDATPADLAKYLLPPELQRYKSGATLRS